MTTNPFPQDISADESAAGFQRLLIDGIGDPMASRINIVPVPIVARILDTTDVLVKIYNLNGEIAYSHRRWGRDSKLTALEHRRWHAIHTPGPNALAIIDNFKTKEVKGMFEDEIIGFKFNYRVA